MTDYGNYNNYNTQTNYNTYEPVLVGKSDGDKKVGILRSPPPQSLSGPTGAGEVPFPDASLSGTDWDALTNDLATAGNLTISYTQVMTLLIQVAAQMRQDQREMALADAQNALQSGLNASEAMKQAAVFALGAAVVSGSVSVVSGGISMGQSASQMKQLNAAKTKVDVAETELKAAEADVKPAAQSPAKQADAPELSTSTAKQQNEEVGLQSGPQKQEVKEQDQADLEQEAGIQIQKEKAKEAAEIKVESDAASLEKSEAVGPQSDKAKADRLEKARGDFNQAERDFDRTNTMVNAAAGKTRGLTELLQGIGGMAGASMNFMAESARAEAKAYEAEGQYEQSMQQADQAFFQQLGDSIRSMMQSMQNVDRSTHEATQAIYNV